MMPKTAEYVQFCCMDYFRRKKRELCGAYCLIQSVVSTERERKREKEREKERERKSEKEREIER